MTATAAPSLDEQLARRGYPTRLIAIMYDDEKEDLIADDCYYDTAMEYKYDENLDLISVSSCDDFAIMPRGQIKDSSLKLTITRSKSGSNSVITFNYSWSILPINRFQDPMGLAWNNSVFSMKSGSFKKEDKYRYKYPGDSTIKNATHSSAKTYAKGGTGYVTWYADLKGYSSSSTMQIVGLGGYGSLTLVPKKTSNSTQIFGHYVHTKSTASFSLSYGGAGFSVSGGSSYDEMGTDITIKT